MSHGHCAHADCNREHRRSVKLNHFPKSGSALKPESDPGSDDAGRQVRPARPPCDWAGGGTDFMPIAPESGSPVRTGSPLGAKKPPLGPQFRRSLIRRRIQDGDPRRRLAAPDVPVTGASTALESRCRPGSRSRVTALGHRRTVVWRQKPMRQALRLLRRPTLLF